MPPSQSVTSHLAAVCRAVSGSPAVRPVILLVAATACIVPLLSAANLERVPLTVPMALAALLALSIYRPHAGLVAVAALIPLSWWIVQTAGLQPMRLAEALVLVALTGALLRLAFARARASDAPTLPAGTGAAATVFMAVATAAVIVELSLTQVGLPMRWSIVADFVRRVSTDYLYGTSAVVSGLVEAARLIEGVALVLIILGCGRRHPQLPRHLAIAVLVGAGAAAAINLSVLVAAVRAAEQPVALLLRHAGVFHGFLPVPSFRCAYAVSGRLLSLATPTVSLLDGRVS